MIRRVRIAILMIAVAAALIAVPGAEAVRKPHVVVLGAGRRVPYTRAGDPAGASVTDRELHIRPLLVDGVLKEWTTGEPHDITDRSFAVRRAMRINDSLPDDGKGAAPKSAEVRLAENKSHWVWQRGPWLLVDRVTGHTLPIKLPDYDPGVSQPSWFRDYAAYCGLTASAKNVYAVVVQIAARKPALVKKIAAWDSENPVVPACAPAEWQREPMRVTFHPVGHDAISYEIVPGSALLVEDSGDDADAASSTPAKSKP